MEHNPPKERNPSGYRRFSGRYPEGMQWLEGALDGMTKEQQVCRATAKLKGQRFCKDDLWVVTGYIPSRNPYSCSQTILHKKFYRKSEICVLWGLGEEEALGGEHYAITAAGAFRVFYDPDTEEIRKYGY